MSKMAISLWTSPFPDWKTIGRQVGKRLWGILMPAADSSLSSEERLLRRLHNVFKGFAYFDTVSEWYPGEPG